MIQRCTTIISSFLYRPDFLKDHSNHQGEEAGRDSAFPAATATHSRSAHRHFHNCFHTCTRVWICRGLGRLL
jgi:hypothetical protein